MKYFVNNSLSAVPKTNKPVALLVHDNWNDWYTYTTLYNLVVRIGDEEHSLGALKIGQRGMGAQQSTPELPGVFEALGSDFFSVGQDENYYESVALFSSQHGLEILSDLRDCAIDLARLDEFAEEDVMGQSLLRSVSRSQLIGRFHRLALGDAKLTEFSFAHSPNGVSPPEGPASDHGMDGVLSFDVIPESKPPTNIHVLIGRNGVGKTTRLTAMVQSLLGLEMPNGEKPGNVTFFEEDVFGDHYANDASSFANMVSMSFSAFDPFVPPSEMQLSVSKLRYTYVGIKRAGSESSARSSFESYSRDELAGQFAMSALACRVGRRYTRWASALTTLEADPLFAEANVRSLLAEVEPFYSEEHFTDRAKAFFRRLSSGHGIVLLMTTKLVELVDERTLVILDEPEGHLHPPLLSAFVRALSDLLTKRNGVAIIATHSPVILQEVPASCVWFVERAGDDVWATRPERETFGENVGVLTRDVFGLEVNKSGFHKMIADEVQRHNGDYDEAVAAFGGQLGEEARALARTMSLKFYRKSAEDAVEL